MLDISEDNVLALVRAAEKVRTKHLAITTTLIRRYIGNYYRSDRPGQPRPENLIFSFIAETVPSIVFDNPQATVVARRSVTMKSIAQWMGLGINQWIKDVRLADELEQVCYDYLFAYGVMKVGLEQRGDYAPDPTHGVMGRFTMAALQPFAARVDPTELVIDPEAKHWGLARMIGDEHWRDLEDVKADPTFDPQAVEKLTIQNERQANRSERLFGSDGGPDRKRVQLYDLYFPEYRQVATIALATGGGPVYVRPPAMFKGPEDGPYEMFGCYVVPSQVYPLSPIAAMAEPEQELNAHVAAAAREAAGHKRIVLVDSTDKKFLADVKNCDTNAVLGVEGLNGKNVVNVEVGGTSESRLAYADYRRRGLDRVSGSSDSRRGTTTGATATESTIAAQSSQSRDEYMHKRFRDPTRRVLAKVGWYLFYEPSVSLPVSWPDEATGVQKEGIFVGGPQPGQEDMRWPDLFLEIEPNSMRRVDPMVQAQQSAEITQFAVQIAPLLFQFPFLNWPDIIDDFGQARNIPDLSTRLLTRQGLQMIQGVMAGQMGGANANFPPTMLPPGADPMMRLAAAGAPVGRMTPPPAGAMGGGGMMGGQFPRPGMPGPQMTPGTAGGPVRRAPMLAGR